MRTNKLILIGASLIVAATPLVISCSQSQPALGENEISLRKVSVFNATPVLMAPQYSMKEGGEGEKNFQRSFFDAPPMVPHKVGENDSGEDCLDCHEEEDKETKTPGVPASHKIKAVIKSVSREQSKQGLLHEVQGHAKVQKGINNERYFCTTCHVTQAMNLNPLVENDFNAVTPKDAQQDVLDQLNTFQY